MEALSPDGSFSVDIELVIAGLRIAFEVDGPSHFAAGSRLPLGSTKLRDFLLERHCGYTVVSMPYFDLERCAGEPGGLAAYCASRLRSVGVELVGEQT
jgi:hypothetical protein